MSGTPETTYAWRPGQILRLAASLLLALAKVIERLNPATLLEMVTVQTERLGDRLFTVLSDMTLALLPLFTEGLSKDWQVIEDGEALPDDWDPTEFFTGLELACVHVDGEAYLTGEELVKRIRERMNGRREFDQHILNWLFAHWDDPRIPTWFKEAVESGDIYVVATGTILLNPGGRRCVLCLYWDGSRLYWSCDWLSSGGWNRDDRGLVSSDS